MNWFIKLLSSTLGRKLLMALTGLFLILFLVVHLIGNLQLLKNDDGEAFNVYAKFMTSNPVIKTISYVNYACFIIHALWALFLTIGNRRARGSQRYAVIKNSSPWTSRNMGILGTLILIFLVIHLKGFWYEMHWGGIPTVNYDGEEVKDLYATVETGLFKRVVCCALCIQYGGTRIPLVAWICKLFSNAWLESSKI